MNTLRTSRLTRSASPGVALTLAASLTMAGCAGAGGSKPTARTAPLPAPTSTTEAPPQYPHSSYSWDRSTSPQLAIGGGAGSTLAAVIAPTLNQPWMVVGTRTSPAGLPEAFEWTSPDGLTWTPEAISGGDTPSSATGAAQYRGETVVVGSVGTGSNRQAAAWLSPGPGAPFTAVPVPLSAGPSSISAVAAGALGLFATGTVDGRFALWSSTDGRRFGEQADAEKVIASAPGSRVQSLMAEGDTVYAAGWTGSGANQSAAVWATNDGLHWRSISTAANAFTGPGSRMIFSLAPLGNGLVAVGAINRGAGWEPASWVSPDGASWSPPSTDFPGVPTGSLYGPSGGTAARSVAAVETFAGSTAVVAVGGGPNGQAAWRSTDGLHWSQVALPAADASAQGWRATLTAGTVNTMVVADGDPGQPHLITENGATWSEPSADPAVFGPTAPEAVPLSMQPVGGSLVMTVEVVADPQKIGPALTNLVSLQSANGTDWIAVPVGAGRPPSIPTAGALTVETPAGWVAVGESASGRPAGWTSTDGRGWMPAGPLPSGLTGTAAPATPTTTTMPANGLAASVNGLCALPAAPLSGTGTALPGSSSSTSSTTAGSAGLPATGLTTVVAVGSAVTAPPPGGSAQAASGHQAAVWTSVDGTGWKPATLSPAPAAGAVESMSGCARTTSGLIAWGASTGPGGATVPALWRSTNGQTWNRVDGSAFQAGSPAPITDVAVDGPDWLAVADPYPGAGPAVAAPDPLPGSPASELVASGPAATADSPGGVGPVPAFEGGGAAIWSSTDDGSTWNAIDTAAPPWLGTDGSAADLVAFAGRTPVVAGSIDGQLAVWTGS